MKQVFLSWLLWLCLCLGAWADFIVVVDLADKTISVTNSLAIRETVNVQIINIAPSAASNLQVRITDRAGNLYAASSTWTAGGGDDAIGTLDLNTTELAVFFTNRAPQAVASYTMSVWDSVLSSLLVNDVVQISNNPYVPGMPEPTPATWILGQNLDGGGNSITNVNIVAGTVSGDGSGLTNLPATLSGLTSGSLVRATSASTVANATLATADIPSTIAKQLIIGDGSSGSLGSFYQSLKLSGYGGPGIKFEAQEDTSGYAYNWWDKSQDELHWVVTDGADIGYFLMDAHGVLRSKDLTATNLVSGPTGYFTGTVTASSFSGDGSGLTNIVIQTQWEPINPVWYYLGLTDIPRGTADSTNTITTLDARIENRIVNPAYHDQQIDVHWVRGLESVAYSVLPTNLASVSTNGLMTHLADGTVTATVVSASLTNTTTKALAQTGTATNQVWVTGIANSVRSNACTLIDGLLADSGNDINIWSTYTPATTSYVRNVSCWAASLDLSCHSPWNTTHGKQFGLTLISPRHAVYAVHPGGGNGAPAVGASVHWVATDNTVQVVTVSGVAQVSGTDIGVAYLSAAVTNCTVAKVMPATWATYLRNNGYRVPVVALNQYDRAYVRSVVYMGATVAHWPPQTALLGRSDATGELVGGDSGNPLLFYVTSGEPVILGTHYSAGSDVSMDYRRATVNTLMTTLGGTNQLISADWSSYASF